MTQPITPEAPAGPATGAPAAADGGSQPVGATPNSSDDAARLNQVVAELGLTPGQVAERLKASRKWEDRAKQREDYDQIKTELDQLRAANMTDAEKARTEAFEGGRAAERATLVDRVVAAEFRAAAALAGRDVAAVDGLLEDLNVAKFIGADGSVDAERIKARVQALPTPAGQPEVIRPRGATGQGSPPAPGVQPGAAGLAEAQRRFGAPAVN
jgi:hypothetical protein